MLPQGCAGFKLGGSVHLVDAQHVAPIRLDFQEPVGHEGLENGGALLRCQVPQPSNLPGGQPQPWLNEELAHDIERHERNGLRDLAHDRACRRSVNLLDPKHGQSRCAIRLLADASRKTAPNIRTRRICRAIAAGMPAPRRRAVDLDPCLHLRCDVPVDLQPKSHIDTPAWQSFEMRMRARATERRQAKRRRRLRRLTYAAVGLLAMVLGIFTAVTIREMDRRAVREPIVVEWPPLPGPPVASSAVELRALPLPAGWDGSVEGEGDASGAMPEEDATASAPTPAEAVPSAPIARAKPAASTPAERSTAPEDRARPPANDSNAPPSTRLSGSPSSPRETVAAPVPTSGSTVLARGGSMSSSTPAGAAESQNRSLEPLGGTSLRNQPVEPLGGTDPRNQPPARRSPEGRAGVEPLGGTSLRNPPLEPVAAARPSPPPVVDPPRSDPRESVHATLERYRSAYQRLDAPAARAVWPSVDAGALARAFGSLSSQELWFDGCTIDVSGSAANATCTGQSRVVPKIGGGSETTRRTWQFTLRQSGRDWVIEKATVK